MKTIAILMIAALTSLSAQAAKNTETDKSKFFCKQTNTPGGEDKKTVVLTQLDGPGEIMEGVKYSFLLEVFQSGNATPILSTKVKAETEDVHFGYKGPKGSGISGHIYLDEFNEAGVTIGSEVIQLDCE